MTAEIIELAKVRDSAHCMVAEAVHTAYPAATSVAVDVQTIRFSIPVRDIRCIYLTPRAAQLGIIDFDQGETPEPFTFVLRGAQVIPISHKAPGRASPRPQKTAKQLAALAKGRAVLRPQSTNSNTKVPDKIGGQAPPLSGFARKRAFGLRALNR